MSNDIIQSLLDQNLQNLTAILELLRTGKVSLSDTQLASIGQQIDCIAKMRDIDIYHEATTGVKLHALGQRWGLAVNRGGPKGVPNPNAPHLSLVEVAGSASFAPQYPIAGGGYLTLEPASGGRERGAGDVQ